MSAEQLHLLVIGVVLLALAYKAAHLARSPRPGLWALWTALLALEVALVVGYAPVGGVLDRAVPGLGWVVQHETVFAGLFAVQVFFVCSTHPSERRRRAILGRALVVAAGMALMLVGWAVAQTIEAPEWAEVRWAEHPWSAVANLLFVTGVAVSLLLNARLTAHWAAIADRPWLRRGLILLTAGGWLSGAWAVHRIAYISTALAGTRLPWDQQLAELALLTVGLCTGIAGVTLPAWAPRLAATRQWLTHYRSYRRLAPLWQALRAATPSIALPSPAPWWHMEYRLYRRVIEIWDGHAALRTHLPPPVHSGPKAEAEALRAALTAKLAGHPPTATTPTETRQGSRILADEVMWLERVAAHWPSA